MVNINNRSDSKTRKVTILRNKKASCDMLGYPSTHVGTFQSLLLISENLRHILVVSKYQLIGTVAMHIVHKVAISAQWRAVLQSHPLSLFTFIRISVRV